MKMSIVVPAHNEEQYLDSMLQAVTQQMSSNDELIVVCDSCIDETYPIAKKHTSMVYEVNFKNAALSRNHGARKATGELLVFLDADTIISEGYLKALRSQSKIEHAFGGARLIPESDHWFMKVRLWIMTQLSVLFKIYYGSNFFISTKLFWKIGGYRSDLQLCDDVELSLRAAQHSKQVIHLSRSIFVRYCERKFKTQGYMFLTMKRIILTLQDLVRVNYVK